MVRTRKSPPTPETAKPKKGEEIIFIYDSKIDDWVYLGSAKVGDIIAIR